MMVTLTKNTKIGWIGTGVMGISMAQHLIDKGYNLTVYNRTASKAQSLIQAGASWAKTPAEVAQSAEIIFTMVGFPQDVEEVYFGNTGIFQAVKRGAILIDMTTTLPSLAQKIDLAATERGAFEIDAPVSGGDVGARNGTLSIMVGGNEAAVKTVMPLFNILGKQIVYQGKAGAGQHTKMCNQIVIAGTMIGVCESLLYGFKAGLDLETMLSSIGGGAASCWTLSNLAPRVIQGNFEPGFYVEHFIKDMEIALKEASQFNIALPGLALVHQLYKAVQAQGNGRKGTQALYLALKSISGL